MVEIEEGDIQTRLEEYNRMADPMIRRASYDFCFGYFQTHRHHLTDNMELSCLHLWSYLASWGMMRNSKLETECSMKVLEEVIKYLEGLTRKDWCWDVEDYCDESARTRIVGIYDDICERVEGIKIREKKQK